MVWHNPADNRPLYQIPAAWISFDYAMVAIDMPPLERKPKPEPTTETTPHQQLRTLWWQRFRSFIKAVFVLVLEQNSIADHKMMRGRLQVCTSNCEPVINEKPYFVPSMKYRRVIRAFLRLVNGAESGHCRLCSCQLSAKRVFWNKIYHKEDSCPHPGGSQGKKEGV